MAGGVVGPAHPAGVAGSRTAGGRTGGPSQASWVLLAVVGLCALLPHPAAPQATGAGGGQGEGRASGGVLGGLVVDADSGAPVEGARVEWSGPSSGHTTTGDDGRWASDPLPPGPYTLRVGRLGFASAERTGVQPAEAPGVRFALERQALPLDALVITASRRTQRLADAPVQTELISRQELEMSGSADLSEVLVERTGIQLQGGHPTGSGIMLQGMDSRRVLVLVDGQPWIGRLSGDIDLARLPTAGVERVEIVKGPQSTLYGSEAMGGVVNVVTRSPGVDRWEAGGRLVGGSGGRLDGSLRGEWPVGPVALLAEVGRRSVDRVPGLDDVPGAGVTRLDGRGRAHWTQGEVDLSASVLAVEETQQWRTGQLTQFADNVQWTSTLTAGWTRGAHRLEPALSASSFDHLARQGLGSAPPPASGRRQVQRRSEVELIYAWVPGDVVSVDAGVEARRETLEAPDLPAGRLDLDAVEPFTQVTLRRGPVTLVPGVRMSWSREWGTYTSPRLSAMVKAGGGWTFRGAVARGFRAPDGKELGLEFLNVGPGYAYLVRGNPDLRPETSVNVTTGLEWSGRRFWGRSQLFHTSFDHFIETAAVGDSSSVALYTYDNLLRGWSRGVELEAGGSHGSLRFEGGWSFLDTRDEVGGGPLLGRPRHSGRLSVQHLHASSLNTSLTGTWTGEAALGRDAEGAPLVREGFLRLDARLSRELPGALELSVGVDNLLDARPRDWPGSAERAFHVGLTFMRGGAR